MLMENVSLTSLKNAKLFQADCANTHSYQPCIKFPCSTSSPAPAVIRSVHSGQNFGYKKIFSDLNFHISLHSEVIVFSYSSLPFVFPLL